MYMYGDSVNLITVETEMSMLSFNAVRFLTEQNHSSEEHAETLARVPLYRLEWVHYIMHDVGGSAVVQQNIDYVMRTKASNEVACVSNNTVLHYWQCQNHVHMSIAWWRSGANTLTMTYCIGNEPR